MIARLRTLLLILATTAITACAWAPPQPAPAPDAAVLRSVSKATQHNPVLQTAQAMLGIPYKYGGHSPDEGFDCSGLVFYAHRSHGIDVPRTAQGLYRAAAPIPQDQLSPGDLMFFKTRGKRVSHVGFYVGPGRFLHAPSRGKTVSIAEYSNSYWRTRFAGAGRIVR